MHNRRNRQKAIQHIKVKTMSATAPTVEPIIITEFCGVDIVVSVRLYNDFNKPQNLSSIISFHTCRGYTQRNYR